MSKELSLSLDEVERTRAVCVRLDLVRGDDIHFQAFPHTLLSTTAMQLAFVSYEARIMYVYLRHFAIADEPTCRLDFSHNFALHLWCQVWQNKYV